MTVPADLPDRRYKLTLHYDGERFRGWQHQPSGRTVQGEVEAALERLTGRPTSVVAAGRTDTGVHAIGQVASAVLPARWTEATIERALNAVLPTDVWIAAVQQVPMAFHARYHAVGRGYLYRVGVRRDTRSPFHRRWCWPLIRDLNADALHDAAARFHTTHDFRRFARSGQPERGSQCTIIRSEWAEWGGAGYEYRVVANRFLHHMVRYMVGTMIDIARGRRPADDVDALLGAAPGVVTSRPSPAAGLCLVRIYYDQHELAAESGSAGTTTGRERHA
ncbi:MAG TPA: tRNA pseudouridine(38-40) synthase TruA [Longimicrobiales bacterium]|nr:tRNA pseudouridine(38-40) synthase TruA [Longimicrobiales bacterium]